MLQQQKRSVEDVHFFFTFPKQQYWEDNTFTPAQQCIEEVTLHITRSDKNSMLLL